MPNLVQLLIGSGTLLSASQRYGLGRAQQKAADAEALQMEQAAGQSVAASQRNAAEERRKFSLLQSRAQALAGSGASDPQIMRTIADLAGEGAYRSALELYEGESRAEALRYGATVRRAEGKAAKRAGQYGALSSLISGGALLAKYGGAGIPTQSAAPIEDRDLIDPFEWTP